MSKGRWVVASLSVLLVASGLVVRFVGDPVLLRFPLDTNQTLHYRGTVSVGVNPTTMAPLASPLRLPLEVSRTVRVNSGSYSRAVIDESIAMTFAGSTRTESYRYVMDRRTMQLYDSPLSYAFNDRRDVMTSIGGSYRINLPMGTSSADRYRVWVPQAGTTAEAVPVGPAYHADLPNTDVVTFSVDFLHRVAPYYLAYLQRNGFPTVLPASTLSAELQAGGVSAAETLRAATPYLTASQLNRLRNELSSMKVPLEYSYFEHGQISVQPETGVLVDAKSAREGVEVRPDLSNLHALAASLDQLKRLPAVQRLDSVIAAMAAPRTVLDLSYSQTPSSVRAVTATAEHQAGMIALVKWQLPLVLFVAGVVGLLALALWRPRRRRKRRHLVLLGPPQTPPPIARTEESA